MPKLFDVVYPAGTYNDPNTGQEKTRWMNCGAIIQTQAGKTALKLDMVPTNPGPNQDGQPGLWLQCMEPRPRTAAAPAQPPAPPPAPTPAAPDDDIPF